MTTSTLGISDPDVKRALRAMNAEIDALKARLEGVVSQEGTFIANLGLNTVKSTASGEKTVTAGAITVLDDTDDLTEGTSNLWLTGAGDADDLTESGTRKFVGSGGGGTMDVIVNGTSFKKVETNAVDGSGRIIKLRRSAADLDTDDISRLDEVQSNIGGVGNADLRDGGTTIIDVSAREMDIGRMLDAVIIGTSPDGETSDRIRAASVRGLNAINASYEVAGNLVEDVTGVNDGVSTEAINIDIVNGNTSMTTDTGGTGGDGTGEGGNPAP